jgi:hypothetical protein
LREPGGGENDTINIKHTSLRAGGETDTSSETNSSLGK